MKRTCTFLVLIWGAQAGADAQIASRISTLSDAIDRISIAAENSDYHLLKIQPIDTALVKRGFENPHVRIVFIGRPAAQHQVIITNPKLLGVLPIRLSLIEEGDRITVSSDDLELWKAMFPDPESVELIESWQRDLKVILNDFAGD
jgi:uncharacterized protein (DUF302 family)